MSVPLDRLYNFLHDVCNRDDIIIYRFYPHGSRKIEDCGLLTFHNNFEQMVKLPMICHDQEPLNFSEHVHGAAKAGVFRSSIYDTFNFYDRVLLLHSEQRSEQVQKFSSFGAIPVYFWSHAVIALDWFRYAQHDPKLSQRNIQKLFLVYNRAWTGTREYRLKFTEMICSAKLVQQCQMKFNPWDQNEHYTNHKFVNSGLKISNKNLEQNFDINQTPSSASADYVATDYSQTGLEIVLETLFDDCRWHLTEKTLRPIACGQPFMLAATPGSLEYLRGYGFKTFAPYIDETYDTIKDPRRRLQAIVMEMKKISQLDSYDQAKLFDQLYEVARYNQQRFFSKEFFQYVLQEYQQNIKEAVDLAQTYYCASYYKNYKSYFETNCDLDLKIQVEKHAKNHTRDSNSTLKFM